MEPTVETRQRSRVRGYHNIARDFHESRGYTRFQLSPPRMCQHCRAKLFERETLQLCCSNGMIKLPEIQSPTEIFDLFSAQTPEGRHFRQHIRTYNHVFSFTSMGVHVDENLAGGRQGVYTFRAQGSIYHKIGSLLPQENSRPRYLQMYVYDTEHETENRMAENEELDTVLLEKLKCILDQHNPFVSAFRQLAQRSDIQNCRLIIKEKPSNECQYDLPTASQVAAVIIGGDEVGNLNERDIVVETTVGNLIRVQDIIGYYDPLQYPLLLPCGTYGWGLNIPNNIGEDVTCREFYAYMLQIRPNSSSLLLRGGRLLQQYAVDNYVKIETHKLRYVRNNQHKYRIDIYAGLEDSLNSGVGAGDVGQSAILPSSFVGSPRDMNQRYQDAMALILKLGKPTLFITMTCNPNWEEIKKELLPGQTSQDRPDLLARIFHAKFEELKTDVIHRGVLGKVIAYAYVIEFQKRGLPHTHMVVVLDDNDKLYTPDDYDLIVRAEIPFRNEEVELYAKVLKHMIHGPCEGTNSRPPCRKKGSCKRNYPKSFAACTTEGRDSYPVYRRRDTGFSVPLGNNRSVMVNNTWVVPYNPWLLLKYDCHINVEICSSFQCVKYLYKYIYKGPDRVSLEVRLGPTYDEVQHFVDARWVCAPEALWKIFAFPMSKIYPSVLRLQIHLPNRQMVHFNRTQTISDVLNDERNTRTMLTEFFAMNRQSEQAKQFLYREFPEHYRWVRERKVWQQKRGHNKVIGRIYTVSPSDTQKFYLRTLLNHVRGPESFDDLLTVNGVTYPTFKQAAEARGLLENDDGIRQCLCEASTVRMPSALRRLFVTILVFCEPAGVRLLWNEFYHHMIEDYATSSAASNVVLLNKLLHELKLMLLQHNKNITDYDLPRITEEYGDNTGIPACIEDELAIPISPEDLGSVDKLNADQMFAYTTIMGSIERKENVIFFVDGPGGTGKTFLYRALLANLRNRGHIAIATATSSIAATILPGGRTAHSRFKIPIKLEASSVCSISKQSDLSKLINRATVILWDEAPMTHRHAFEAVDRTFRDITNCDMPFGGKVIVLGGDFRQVLPVVLQGTKSQLIDASIVKSTLWNYIKVLHLNQNMRSINDQQFSKFLLQVGDGEELALKEDFIRLPQSMVIPWENDESINGLIDAVFPNLADHANDPTYMVGRAIVTPKNEDVDMINDVILRRFSTEEMVYYSWDSIEGDNHNLYQEEFLNSITPSGMPPHKLILKKGSPIMLLRNLDPKLGLCNGTRLICRNLFRNCIHAEIISGPFAGTRTFLHRIPLKSAENQRLPFELTRKQFPVRFAGALTINKSQGQTIPHVGIFLPDHVFSHGQLYVALSRGVSENKTKVLVKKGKVERNDRVFTRNVVYKEVLLHHS